ncbi:MAG: tetratricopeptide repeat protein [Planctomycetota bacterium]
MNARTLLLTTPTGLLVGLLTGLLSGCAGQGSYTGELAASANSRMSALRVRTEMGFAQQAFDAGRLDRVEERVAEALSIDPEAAAAHVMLARISIERGRLAAAGTAAEQAVAIDPSNAEAAYVLGLVRERAGDHEGALNAFTRAVELDPEDAHAVIAVAETLEVLGRSPEAASALANWPGHKYHPGALQFLGQLMFAHDEPELAVSWLEDARLLAPEDAGILEDLALAYIAVGRDRDAEALLRDLRARAASAGDSDGLRPDVLLQHAVCLERLGRDIEARDTYEALAGAADSPSLQARCWSSIGRLSVNLSDASRVREAASRLVGLQPDDADGYMLWAMYYGAIGNVERARQSIEHAVGLATNEQDITAMRTILEQLRTDALTEVPTDG